MKQILRMPKLFLCLLLCLALCGCGQESSMEENREEARENINRVLEQHEEKYTFDENRVHYNDEYGNKKTEYTAEKDGSKMLGYPATIYLRCNEKISGQDLADISAFELASLIIGGYSDVVECTVKATLETKEKQEIFLRFSNKSRRTVAVYLDGKPKEKADYYVDINLPEDLLIYTNLSVEDCEYKLPESGETLKGKSAIEEITLLQELDDDELEEFLQKFIKSEIERQDGSQPKELLRIEYQFAVYQFGEKRASIVMRSVNKDMDKWEIVES